MRVLSRCTFTSVPAGKTVSRCADRITISLSVAPRNVGYVSGFAPWKLPGPPPRAALSPRPLARTPGTTGGHAPSAAPARHQSTPGARRTSWPRVPTREGRRDCEVDCELDCDVALHDLRRSAGNGTTGLIGMLSRITETARRKVLWKVQRGATPAQSAGTHPRSASRGLFCSIEQPRNQRIVGRNLVAFQPKLDVGFAAHRANLDNLLRRRGAKGTPL